MTSLSRMSNSEIGVSILLIYEKIVKYEEIVYKQIRNRSLNSVPLSMGPILQQGGNVPDGQREVFHGAP